MLAKIRPPLFPAVIVLAAGCSWLNSEGRTVRSGGGVRSEGGAFIIYGSALDEREGPLLRALVGRVPGLAVHRQPGECPRVTIRSHATFRSEVNPLVYVDGSQATDTCILESLRTEDVESVEVYPMGVTKRPGYATHAHGLILVFMRSGPP